MDIGKVPNSVLRELILNKIRCLRNEVILRPGIGEDCTAVNLQGDLCVLSTDPITGTASEIGRLAVHISCNDVAACGAEPVGLMATILAPPSATTAELDLVMKQICDTAASLNVDIIGGHTEITAAVNRFVLNSVAVGRVSGTALVTSSGARPGDSIIMTKAAGLEGTAIIAHDLDEELAGVFGDEFVKRAKGFINEISVVKEGVIAGRYGVSSMHDATEGGILGALWELTEASGYGARIDAGKVMVRFETRELCRHFGIDPLRLVSSGCMLITCQDGEGLVRRLKDENINAAIIGEITQGKERTAVSSGVETKIDPPGPDELYKVL